MPYAPSIALPLRPAMLETMMTLPSARSAICGMTMLHSHRLLRTLLAIILSKASSVMVAIGPKCGLTAALQTSVSIRPHVASVRSTSPCSAALSEMFAACAIAVPPLAVMASATTAHASALRLEITTLAPDSAMRSAMARPIPREDPVISATFPCSENISNPPDQAKVLDGLSLHPRRTGVPR